MTDYILNYFLENIKRPKTLYWLYFCFRLKVTYNSLEDVGTIPI